MFTTATATIAKTTPDFENNRQLILKLDPLVGDAACHVRTAYLFYLYQKPTALTSPEITFLNNCAQLPALSLFDAFGFTVQQTSPKGKIAKFKSQVASASLDFLLQSMPADFFEIDSILNKRQAIDFVGHDIPVYPFYTSVKMLLNFIINNDIPLIINLKRVEIKTDADNKYYQLLGTSTLLYRYDMGSKHFQYIETSPDDPTLGITFDMYSTLNEEDLLAPAIPEFFSEKDYHKFLIGFKNLAVDKLILMCAAAHYQFPHLLMEKLSSSEQITYLGIFKESHKRVDTLLINHEVCNLKEYRRVFALSNQFGLTQADSLLINRKGKENYRTTRSIPFMVDHTYLDNFNQCYQRIQTLFATQHQTIIVEANTEAPGVAP